MRFRFFIFILFPFVLANVAFSQKVWKFDFGPGRAAKDFKQIEASDIYNKEKGYGFEPGATVECIDRGGKNLLFSDLCASDKPFYFSVAVPEGNYRVTITFGDKSRETKTTVKAELRRLMLEEIETKKGGFVRKTFIVNVRTPQIAGGGEVKLKEREKTTEWWAWDEKLTLEFNNSRPSVAAVEIEKAEDLPTVFLLGDSTVCDQPREPYASWGQMVTRFFRPTVAIANHAESGESLRSSFGAKRLDKVLSLIKPGDYLLIQYGHNDEKEKGEGVGAMTTYKASLKKFVEETRRKGGVPVLITPMHRRTFDGNEKITNSHGDYPEAVRQVAREEKVALIDLTDLSKDFYEALGRERSGAAFKEGDGTHHNNYGAYELAKMIAAEIKKQNLPLAKFLIKGLPRFDPKKPDPVESFALPASPLATDVKPLGN
ncbi:MAG: rhamnogalacturonan acetylesterase [Pyrinomonadaceae bacterium]